MAKKVVCTFSPPNREAIIKENPELDIKFPSSTTPGALMGLDELKSSIEGAEALVHAQIHIQLSKQTLSLLPSSLKVISNHGAGYDGLDLTYATERGIWVSNTPNVVNDATADIAMLLILSVTRRAFEAEQKLRQGNWTTKGLNDFLGHDPKNKVLGIIGFGGIGKALGKRAAAFGMRIIYNNRTQLSSEEESAYGARYVSLEELLRTSDYISLHCPLTEQTRHMIDTPQFEQMKKGAYLINTSRGPVVHERALVEALHSGKLSGAGLDVFEKEPLGDTAAELRSLPNVTLLPHIGTATYESRMDMSRVCFENVRAVLIQNKKPPNALNNV